MATLGNYLVKNLIGEGGFARIYQAEHSLLHTSACLKQCKENSDEYRDLLMNEAKILWKLCEHHSIPHAKDFLEADDGSYVMVMSYIDGKTLDDLIPEKSRMYPEDACWITERLLESLYYCHYNGVIHSDIKPGNVMVEYKKHDIKLIDFGLAIYKPTSTSKPLGYTKAFVAPEILEGKPPIPETDIYGAGLTMLYALGGNPLTKTMPADIPPQIKEFCNSMIVYNPADRPNWDKLNLVQRLSDIRMDVFGRRHTDFGKKLGIDK